MRRTKILVTVGPATCSEPKLAGIVRAGADSFRLNFSHGTDSEHRTWLARMRKVRQRAGRELPIVGDVQGPKVRIGPLTSETVRLIEGAEWKLDGSLRAGDAHRVGTDSFGQIRSAQVGDPILLGDGGVELTATHVDREGIRARVVHGGLVHGHTGLFLPRTPLRTNILGPKDRHDMELGVSSGIDFLAVSFVRNANDLRTARSALDRHPGGDRVGLIAKIERAEAVEAIDEILPVSDAIMVARGDLGIELPLERLALAQKMLVREANRAARPVIVATQMLQSMVHYSRPTRAEATDVANAVLDGADAVMLSEESAIGEFPEESVRWLARIAAATEGEISVGRRSDPERPVSAESSPEREVGVAAVELAHAVRARAIIAPTHSGRTATLISSFRPRVPIVALSAVPETRRRLGLVWGVASRPISARQPLTSLRARARRIALELDPTPGRVILTAGYPVDGRPTNLVTIVEPGPDPTRAGLARPDGTRARSRDRRRPTRGGSRS